jgi:hypothetical protein
MRRYCSRIGASLADSASSTQFDAFSRKASVLFMIPLHVCTVPPVLMDAGPDLHRPVVKFKGGLTGGVRK